MKSSNKNFRTDFENAWSKAFENAESAPPDSVWGKIDGELSKAESAKYKGYYLAYRGITAASVALLLMLSGIFTYNYFNTTKENTSQNLTLENEGASITNNQLQSNTDKAGLGTQSNNITNTLEIAETKKADNKESQSIEKSLEADKKELITREQIKSTQPQVQVISENTIQEEKSAAIISESIVKETSATQSLIASSKQKINKKITFDILPRLPLVVESNTSKPIPTFSKEDIESYAAHAMVIKKTAKDRSKKFYANVNVVTDFFNPNFQIAEPTVNTVVIDQINTMTESNVSQTLLGQQNSPSTSFSYGINMGVKLSGKWILEGGVSYANYNTQSQSNFTLADLNNGTTVPVTLLNRTLITSNALDANLIGLNDIYAVNNSFEFASIPVRAGYVIGIKKINLILKAGVNTDLFIRNEISSKDEAIDAYVNRPSDGESPFRKVHLNGLVANEVNYALNQNYSFSVEANYRFALNSLTRPGEEISSMPDAYGIGMVFRYHFN
ncbi:MAG: hypothetical protein AAGI07_00690 [Bacteroidota bacterium]